MPARSRLGDGCSLWHGSLGREGIERCDMSDEVGVIANPITTSAASVPGER